MNGRDVSIDERADIEMSFIRMLSVNGLILSGNLSMENRRERIRAAIVGQNLKDCPYDSEISFGEAYSRCYSQSVALRRGEPDHGPLPAGGLLADDDEIADEDELADAAEFSDEAELES
jgi:hypothetical protein